MHALVGFDFQRDKIAARATDDNPAVRYFHACTMEKGLESRNGAVQARSLKGSKLSTEFTRRKVVRWFDHLTTL